MILIDILKIWSGRGVPLGHLGVPPGPRHRKYGDVGLILGAFGATLDPKSLPWDITNEKKQEKSGPWRRLGTLPGKMLKKSRKIEGLDLPKPLKYVGFPMYCQCLAYSEKGS